MEEHDSCPIGRKGRLEESLDSPLFFIHSTANAGADPRLEPGSYFPASRRRAVAGWWATRTRGQQIAVVVLAVVVVVYVLASLARGSAPSSAAAAANTDLTPAQTCSSAVIGAIADTAEEVGVTDDPYGVPKFEKQKGDELSSTAGAVETAAYVDAMDDLNNYLYRGERHSTVSNAEVERLYRIGEETCQQYAGTTPN